MGGPSSPGPSVAPPSASTPTPAVNHASPGQPQQQQPQVPTPDPYFTHFDPRMEHQAYKEAQQRLEEAHREKVTKVMIFLYRCCPGVNQKRNRVKNRF